MTGIDDIILRLKESTQIVHKVERYEVLSFQLQYLAIPFQARLSFSVQPNVPIAFLFQYNKRWISLHGLVKPVTKSPKIVHLNLFSYNDKPQLLSYFSTTFTNEVLKLLLHGSKYFVKEIVRKLHIVTMWSWPEDDQDLGYCSVPSLALVVTCNTMPGLWKLESVFPFHLQNRATFVKQDKIFRKASAHQFYLKRMQK